MNTLRYTSTLSCMLFYKVQKIQVIKSKTYEKHKLKQIYAVDTRHLKVKDTE